MTEQDFIYCLTVVVAAFFSAAWIACSYFGRLRAQLHCKDAMIEGLQAQRANLIQKLAKQEDSRHNEEYWPRLTDPKGTLPAGVLEGLQFFADQNREELRDAVAKEMVAEFTNVEKRDAQFFAANSPKLTTRTPSGIIALINEQAATAEKSLRESLGRDIFGEREEVEDNLIDDAAKAALDLYQHTIVNADEYKRITGQAWTYTKDLPQQGCPNSRPLYAPRV